MAMASGVRDNNGTRTDERRGSERHRCLGLARGAAVDEAQNGGAQRGSQRARGGGRSVDNEWPRCFRLERISTKEWEGRVNKHEGVGILFFVWGPLLESHVWTRVTDKRVNWIIINEQISCPVSNDEKTYQF
jgi:hypothetical protein